MDRATFLKMGLGAGLATVVGCSDAKIKSDSKTQRAIEPEYRWKCITTWPPNFPVLGEGANLMAQWVNELSNGRIQIKVYGGGELVPPLAIFDEVMNGTVEIGMSASYYWTGKHPAAAFFCSVPFGMNAQQMNAWLYSGGGYELWKEVYAKFGLIPFPAGNTGLQMGGWFNKEINSSADLKGLKMRIPGFGGKILERVGGAPVLSPASEIYTNLELGVLDGTEWIGPYHDYKMGFHKIAKYYYYPGWHEPGPTLEMVMNKAVFDELPDDIKAILWTVSFRLNLWTLSEFEAKNVDYLEKIENESDVQIRQFPKEVIETMRAATKEVLKEETSKDPLAEKVYQSYQAFHKKISKWSKMTEKIYYNDILPY